MKYSKLLLLFFSFLLTKLTQGQITGPEQDCSNAIPVCQTVYQQTQSYVGNGLLKDIPDGSACLTNEENNSVWYVFTVTQSGLLEMRLAPVAQDDYDFAIYNITNNSCSGILDSTIFPVRCSYFAYGPTLNPPNNNPVSGLEIGGADTTAGPADDRMLRPLNVQVGETYVVIVDNFQINGSGYTLDFTPSPNNPNPASIIDVQPPTMESVNPFSCDTIRTIVLNFNENISCASIDTTGAQFSISGPANIPVVDAEGVGCGSGAFTNQVVLTLDQVILVGGNYSINLQSASGQTISDYCGNQAINNALPFVVPTVAIADFDYTISASCITDTFYFNDNSPVTAISWNWNFGDGTTSTLENPVHVFPDTIPYTVSLVISTGTCSDTVSKVIDVTRSFSADFTISNLTPCLGDTVTFSDNSPGQAANYLWEFGDGNISGSDTATNVYATAGLKTVTLTIADGTGTCSDSVSKTLTVRPLPDANFSTNVDPICSGLPIRFTSSSNASADSIIWNFDNGNFLYDSVAVYTFPIGGTYDVQHTVIDLFCGSDDTTLTFEVLQRPEFGLGNDTAICLSEQIVVTGPSGVDEYRWSTGETTQTIIFAAVPDEVALTVTTAGCTNSDVIFVDERKEDCYYVKIPSAFSPNGDGNNDALKIFLLRIKSFNLKIYNRWGELMFETDRETKLWDGTYKDEPQDMAVFQYVIDGVSISGERFFRSGNVTLIR